MITAMLKPVRIDAGLGNPPLEYTNNDPEAANFMLKHDLHFEKKKPHEFVTDVKHIIAMQFNNEERAIFGMGPYQVRAKFKHLAVDEAHWGRISHAQRVAKIANFLKADVSSAREPSIECDSAPEDITSNNNLTMSAKDSGITSIPLPILQTLFEKAKHLLSTPELIVKQPGATNGSYIVAGHSNRSYCVTPAQGGSLKCDLRCKDHGTGICEHTIAVAAKRNTLNQFICWFKRRRKSASITDLALQGGLKTVGKKPSTRKRSNKKKDEIVQYVDLIQLDEKAEPATPNEPADRAVQVVTNAGRMQCQQNQDFREPVSSQYQQLQLLPPISTFSYSGGIQQQHNFQPAMMPCNSHPQQVIFLFRQNLLLPVVSAQTKTFFQF